MHNELGVLAYRNRDHAAAVKHFERALSLVPHPLSDEWEATVVNLAHANRKRNDFDAAIEWYERALSLAPSCAASTYTALGFTHQLKGNFQSHMSEAIECYHKALGLRPDDTFAQEMLTLALIDQCAVTMPPYEFVPYDPYGPPPERFSGGGERGFRGAEGARGVELDEEEGRGTRGRSSRRRRSWTRTTRTTTWRCRRGERRKIATTRATDRGSIASDPVS